VKVYSKSVLSRSVGMALFFVALPLWTSTALAREPAPVVEASVHVEHAESNDLQGRLARLERLLDNQSLLDLMTRVDSLQAEVQQLVGQVEEQNYAMEQLKKRQRDLYLDIDQRLQQSVNGHNNAAAMPNDAHSNTATSLFVDAMPSGNAVGTVVAGGAAANTASTTSATTSSTQEPLEKAANTPETGPLIDPAQERGTYERAFNLLKEGRYDLAVTAFKAFVDTYPQGSFADNAQYWLGEANYVQRHFERALSEFEKVVKGHPNSPKRGDALLKMGYTYQELGQYDNARAALNEVLNSYPTSTAASLAKKRLQDIKAL
jgi:tol-pal system protein YbgF